MSSVFVNNHIHTTYSFSPYSPSQAVEKAKEVGLRSAGLMDHDSLGGAEEFLEAGHRLGLPVTIGLECRVDFSSTRLKGLFINHPDQPSTAYVAIHGIPHGAFNKTRDFFAPFIALRGKRNAAMVEKINSTLQPMSLMLDYNKDVLPLSLFHKGGSVTERHLLYAVSLALINKFGKGDRLISALEKQLQVVVSPKVKQLLSDPSNIHYAFDLLGILKSGFGQTFYIPAKEECPPVETIVEFAKDIGAILAYAYLGDVAESVTGDKKTQSFEDGYLNLLFEELERLKFQAVTYMPSRNSLEQLKRVQALCKQCNLLEISGEDINSPRQSFICQALARPEFSHLVQMTWALIGHEVSATKNPEEGFFSPKMVKRFPELKERIEYFAALGLQQTGAKS